MKQPFVYALPIAFLTACSTAPYRPNCESHAASPETVLITYRVKPGNENQLQKTVSRAWDVYRREHLVFAQPHIFVREKEAPEKYRFLEIFTWISHNAPDHAPDSVQALWDQMQSLCETREGHKGLEGGEVMLIPMVP